jgi:superfamily II DNA/RNA helicase
VHFADDRAHKYRILDHLLADVGAGQSIVFIATKRDAEMLAGKLQDEGHTAAALHGDMNQRERDRTLTRMRRGGVRTLVATDVAARGLDVPGVTHVINFDLPRQAENYVHRIGRTGRAGASGVAVSLANATERGTLRQIERYTGAAIPAHVIPGLEPRVRTQNAVPKRPYGGGMMKGRGADRRNPRGRPGR